jgi:hypothetical protein
MRKNISCLIFAPFFFWINTQITRELPKTNLEKEKEIQQENEDDNYVRMANILPLVNEIGPQGMIVHLFISIHADIF